MHHQSKTALVIGLLLVIAGCVTPQTVRLYEGPELPPDERAIIKESRHEDGPITVHILELDGEDVLPLPPIHPSIEVLPGEYEITCRVHTSSLIVAMLSYGLGGDVAGPSFKFTIQAEAGHVYRVDGDWDKGEIWIVDETTGIEVAADTWGPEDYYEVEPHKPF